MKLKHISTKFIFAFVGILTAVFAVLMAVLYIGFRVTMNNYIREDCYSLQGELDGAVTEVVNESAYLYGRLVSTANVTLLNEIADSSLPDERREESFAELCARTGADGEYFNDLALIAGDYYFSIGGGDVPSSADLEYLSSNRNRMLFLGSSGGSIIMGIYSSGGVADFSGYFLFYMDEARINQMCNPANTGEGYSFLMRSDGYIVSHVDSSLVGRVVVYSDLYNPAAAPEYKTAVLDGVRSIIVTSRTELLNTRYGFDSVLVSVLDYEYYFGDMDMMILIVSMVCLAALAAATVTAVVRARKLSRPLVLLSGKISSANQLAPAPPSVLSEGDELTQLERTYDKMMNRIFNLVEKSKEDMLLQRKLELESLYMQINPHFLYNTLDAISWMARIKKQPEIDRLVMNLAKFFRLFLHGGDKFVTVADEVEMVKSYLEIDAIRFPGRVSVHDEVEEEASREYILKLILQPIIENCIKYAFASKNGNIYIRARTEDEDIILEVEDDGEGFDVPDDVLEIRPSMEGGYGLKNVNERIRLQYGDGYGLTVSSKKGEGTLVIVRLKKLPPESI